MRSTSAADLLARTEQLARELGASNDTVDQTRWNQFDATLYRTLYELVAAGRTDRHYPSNTTNPLRHTLAAYPGPLNIPMDRVYSVEHAAEMLGFSRRRME